MAVHLVRVIAGTAKGRKLTAPKGLDTRPMTSRAREALFSTIAAEVPGARVLDLFAGSGSLGIEALSRGAASATFVEKARPALQSLRSNLEATGFDGEIIAGDAVSAAQHLRGPFDLVFVDPPFAMDADAIAALLEDLVTATASAATVVVHRRAGEPEVRVPSQMTVLGDRRYGDSILWRYQRR